jgi:hypothetical protein
MRLSEVPDSLLMWAHYAASHTGFIVEFDGWHPYFHQQSLMRTIFMYESSIARAGCVPLSTMGAELFVKRATGRGREGKWRTSAHWQMQRRPLKRNRT